MNWNLYGRSLLEPMGLGETIGGCEMKNVQSLTGLRTDYPASGGVTLPYGFPVWVDEPFRSVLGDPTLHLHYLYPPVSATKNSTSVTWTASSDPTITQYLVSYKDANGFVVRAFANSSSFPSCCSLNLTPTEAASSFVIVRSAKVVTSGNGSYWALSAGRVTP